MSEDEEKRIIISIERKVLRVCPHGSMSCKEGVSCRIRTYLDGAGQHVVVCARLCAFVRLPGVTGY